MEPKKVKKQFISSMTTPDLVSELLGRAIEDLCRADNAFDCSDFDAANTNLIHAQNVLAELQAMLKMQDLASQQASLFLDCVLEQLFYANINVDRPKLQEATMMVERLQTVYMLQFRKE